jgi:beta-N-acetylhexosaminidase
MRFAGLVMTDSLSAGAVQAAGYTVPAAAVAAIKAGADMVLFGSTLTPAQTALLAPAPLGASISSVTEALVAATTAGSLSVDRLDDAVAHVVAATGTDLCRAGPGNHG